MVVTFSGEESGLNGSRYFVEHAPIPIDQIALMVNLDMVGRLVENKIQVCGTQSAAVLPELVQTAAVGVQLTPVLANGLTSRSDHASFYRKEVPVLFMTETVFPDEYHTTQDEAWRLNFSAGAEAARLAADARDLRERGRARHRLEEARALLFLRRGVLLARRLGGSSG